MQQRSAPRLTTACEPCKRKKRKCDGASPFCSMCTRTPSACHYLRPNPRGLPSGYLIALEQRLADTEAALSLSISLILELAPVHSITIRQPSPNYLETMNDQVLDLKKQKALDYLELSSLNHKGIKGGRTPDTSAEKREQQDEWQRWPISSMAEVFSWWSKKQQPPSPRPPKARRVMAEEPEECTRAPSLSPIVAFKDTLDDNSSHASLESSFGTDTGSQVPSSSNNQMPDQRSRSIHGHTGHTTQPAVPLEPHAYFPTSQNSGSSSIDFAGNYAAKLYSRPSTSGSSIVSYPPIVPSQLNDPYTQSPGISTRGAAAGSGQSYSRNSQPDLQATKKYTVSEGVQRVLDRDSGWF
ncbi:hypothetical protein TWF102_000529 [Orbilia oligospora]|uniref:Zn(2)-C6 fungal-type domain-containing protein n=3 Tax=Orbilia oligospora TaxID=2813651 RepID=A0A7C8IZD1_ORBOL|nr:hypothetical protein TWF102_000529 [Orbilia oligospora]KAF3097451.1 hypothetical protein TWF706_007312 [Orbilia oligospora]KAF3104341.1 hypothetical protein TWF103_006998 [Orbilia oligospora]